MTSQPTSSIYSDLKNYAGKITAIKVTNLEPIVDDILVSESVTDKNTKDKNTKDNKKKSVIKSVVVKQTTIEDLVKLIRPPLIPLSDQNGYVHDISTIAARCDTMGHIHKYFLKDITGVNLQCMTCSSGNKFTTTVRTVAESAIGMPFILADNKLSDGAFEYHNPILRIAISCMRGSGKDEVSQTKLDNLEWTVIRIFTTTSLRKIQVSLGTYLATCPQLTQDHKLQISKLIPCVKVAKSKFQKNPLPFNPELANLNKQKASTDDVEQLCLENCGSDKI